MTNTHTLVAKLLTSVLMVGGIALCLSGTSGFLNAQLTGGGSTIMDTQTGGDPMIVGGDLAVHAAAPQKSNGVQIVLGMLLFMLGFGLHALFIMKNERPVHVTGIKNRKGGLKKEYTDFFWIQKL